MLRFQTLQRIQLLLIVGMVLMHIIFFHNEVATNQQNRNLLTGEFTITTRSAIFEWDGGGTIFRRLKGRGWFTFSEVRGGADIQIITKSRLVFGDDKSLTFYHVREIPKPKSIISGGRDRTIPEPKNIKFENCKIKPDDYRGFRDRFVTATSGLGATVRLPEKYRD